MGQQEPSADSSGGVELVAKIDVATRGGWYEIFYLSWDSPRLHRLNIATLEIARKNPPITGASRHSHAPSV
jgi:hypothetical protein